MKKINISFVNPPIASRDWDYIATFDDYEGDGSHPHGHGKSEQEAMMDLILKENTHG